VNRVAEVQTGQRRRDKIHIGGLILWSGKKKVEKPAGSLMFVVPCIADL